MPDSACWCVYTVQLKVNRKLDYPGFRTALTMLAALKYPELESQSGAVGGEGVCC